MPESFSQLEVGEGAWFLEVGVVCMGDVSAVRLEVEVLVWILLLAALYLCRFSCLTCSASEGVGLGRMEASRDSAGGKLVVRGVENCGDGNRA